MSTPGDQRSATAVRRVAVVGAGIMGVRIARELISPPAAGAAAPEVVLVTRRLERARQLRQSFAQSVDVRVADQGDHGWSDGVDVVIVAREAFDQLEVARRHLREGRHVVTTSDDPAVVDSLLLLDAEARAQSVSLVIGAAMSPGLTCLLTRHASALLHTVEEIHVTRHGAAGPACARQRLRALRGAALEWRDGQWVRRPGFSGRELSWFPDPVGARDCYRAALAEPLLLVPAFGGVQRVTARISVTRRDRALAPFPVLVPPPAEGGIGAARVELRGTVDGRCESVVYGVLDRPAVAGAATAAVAALLLPGVHPFGASGLAAVEEPLRLLRELARRGVRAATFEGSRERGDSPTPRSSPGSAQLPDVTRR